MHPTSPTPPAAGDTPAPRPGATAQAWAALAEMGLEDDLLPTVSDRTVPVAPGSKLPAGDIGKVPSRVIERGGQRMAVGMPGWSSNITGPAQWQAWARDPALGVCVQTRRLRAIDIDVPNPVLADAVAATVEACLNGLAPMPWRTRAGTGKRLTAVWLDDEPLDADGTPARRAKVVVELISGDIVELLADGQQFVAGGTHPSGSRYVWHDEANGAGPGGEYPLAFPRCPAGLLDVLVQVLCREFGGVVRGASASTAAGPRLASQVDDPVLDWLHEHWDVLGTDSSGLVHVRCPWEDQHTTDTGPSSTAWLPAGVGGVATGHFRCLHAHCADRHRGDFLAAVGLVEDVASDFEPVVQTSGLSHTPTLPAGGVGSPPAGPLPDGLLTLTGVETAWPIEQAKPPLTRNKRGLIDASAFTVTKAAASPAFLRAWVATDRFANCLLVRWHESSPAHEVGVWRPMCDADYTDMRAQLEQGGFAPVGRELIRDAIESVARRRVVDTLTDEVHGLVWDGVRRAERLLPDYYQTEDTPYTRAVGLYLFTALASRALDPGAKVDMIPVMLSAEGYGKTSAVQSLALLPEHFAEADLAMADDNLARKLRGKAVVEFAELKGLRARGAEATKAWITRQVEEWIPKFKEMPTRAPRRFVVIGTGNELRFMSRDVTGFRRWLPFRVGQVQLDALRADVRQLWAEGAALYRQHGLMWQDAERLARDVVPAFTGGEGRSDDIAAHITVWLRTVDEFRPGLGERWARPFRATEALVGAGFPARDALGVLATRAARALEAMGFERQDSGEWVLSPDVSSPAWPAGMG